MSLFLFQKTFGGLLISEIAEIEVGFEELPLGEDSGEQEMKQRASIRRWNVWGIGQIVENRCSEQSRRSRLQTTERKAEQRAEQ